MATCTQKEKYSLEQDKEQDNKKIIEFDYNYQKWNLITKYRKTESETHMCDITKIK
jgi:hypothetical protein